MKTNIPNRVPAPLTHEGTNAVREPKVTQLLKLCLCAMLFEDTFYEGGSQQAKQVQSLVADLGRTKPEEVAKVAVICRDLMYIRHMPLFLVRELARIKGNGTIVADTLDRIVQRPDELTEYLALYFKDNPDQPLSAGSKRGLARAFRKFNEYSLAKYDQDGAFKLKDVLRLVHPTPSTANATQVAPLVVKIDGAEKVLRRSNSPQAQLWAKVITRTLETPDTWEVELSAGKDKKAVFERLLKEDKLGGLAFLRNLRNMEQAGVDRDLIRARFDGKFDRVLPFRFITAARYAPKLEADIERAMLRVTDTLPKLKGRTALIVDTSPSMWQASVSAKSELGCFDAAAALAILIREICEDCMIWTFNQREYEIPNRRGFALRDVMDATKGPASYGGDAVEAANKAGYDRIIVLTDGQWHVRKTQVSVTSRGHHWGDLTADAIKVSPKPLTNKAYMIHVGNYANTIDLGAGWHYMQGWSERILDYIQLVESSLIGS